MAESPGVVMTREWQDAFALVRNYTKEYIKLPARLARDLSIEERQDIFGMEVRYASIRAFLQQRQPLGRLVDIGGGCGYFSLSLLDEGLVSDIVIYDVVPEVAAFGERVAAAMGLADRCRYVNAGVSLSTLSDLPDADVVICQNVIHHAGAVFDKAQVESQGWDGYAVEFMRALRAKYRLCVFGMAYKPSKPAFWDVPQCARPGRFSEILAEAGWTVRLDRNVHEMMQAGNASLEASSRRRSPVRNRLLTAAWRVGGLTAERQLRSLLFSREERKTERYYLYLME